MTSSVSVGVVVNIVGSRNVIVVVMVVLYSRGSLFCPAMLGPPKYASALEFMFGKTEEVPHITFPSSSVTAAAVMIFTEL